MVLLEYRCSLTWIYVPSLTFTMRCRVSYSDPFGQPSGRLSACQQLTFNHTWPMNLPGFEVATER